MIYFNTAQISAAKTKVQNTKKVARYSRANNVDFGQKTPKVVNGSYDLLKHIVKKIFKNGLTEKVVINQFGKKSIEKYKGDNLVEKILFKSKDDREYPNLVLKYKEGVLVKAKGLREDGSTSFKRVYDKKTGEQLDEIIYAEDGKSPTIYGL